MQSAKQIRTSAFAISIFAFLFSGPIEPEAAAVGSWSRTCVAPNWKTGAREIVAEKTVTNPRGPFFGFTGRQPGGHSLIEYNRALTAGADATAAAKKFIFYHECAHAQTNSSDEHLADCRGLAEMARDMTVTPQMISEITALYASRGRPFPSAGEFGC